MDSPVSAFDRELTSGDNINEIREYREWKSRFYMQVIRIHEIPNYICIQGTS